MGALRFYFQKLLALLRVRPIVGGLEVTDEVLRLVYFDGKNWKLYATRLEPGVLESGKIKDRPKFLASLVALKTDSKIGEKGSRKIVVVLALSSANIYSQVVNLPSLGPEELVKAVELNLQMTSPEDISKMYSGWEVVGRNETSSNLEVMSSVVEKEIVDGMVQTLLEAGFLTMAIEPRSLALARILREKGAEIDPQKAYLLVSVDNAGMDFLVIRNGEPYFEYHNRWSEIADKTGAIGIGAFEADLAASLRRVLNFYTQHWQNPIAAVIISAVNLQEQIEKTAIETLALPTVRLTLEMGQPISSEWLVGLGCNLRGLRDDLGKQEINLLGVAWQSRFYEEQWMRFLEFWRVLMPIALGILALVFSTTYFFLVTMRSSLEGESGINAGVMQSGSVTDLRNSVAAFNKQVAMISALEKSIQPKNPALEDIRRMADAAGITIGHLVFPGTTAPMILTGVAPSEDQILAFKQALSADSHVSQVDLPLTQIQSNGGSYSFSVTFRYGF